MVKTQDPVTGETLLKASLRAIKPPEGFTYYQFVAVHVNTQCLIFSNNGTDWVSYDGLPVR